jgi:hypothetical protein
MKIVEKENIEHLEENSLIVDYDKAADTIR